MCACVRMCVVVSGGRFDLVGSDSIRWKSSMQRHVPRKTHHTVLNCSCRILLEAEERADSIFVLQCCLVLCRPRVLVDSRLECPASLLFLPTLSTKLLENFLYTGARLCHRPQLLRRGPGHVTMPDIQPGKMPTIQVKEAFRSQSGYECAT